MKTLHPIVVAFLLFISGGTQAQKSSSASGGEATGSGGSVSYTIGQMNTTTNSATNGSVAQGVQHPYEVYSVGMAGSISNMVLSVYPNPIINNLTLSVPNFNKKSLSYQLLDVQGRLIEQNDVVSNRTYIGMSHLPSSIYYLKILQKNKKIQLFKIIKTQ